MSTPAAWIDLTRMKPAVVDALRNEPRLRVYADAVRRTKALKLIVVDAGPDAVSAGFATNLNVTQVPTSSDLAFRCG